MRSLSVLPLACALLLPLGAQTPPRTLGTGLFLAQSLGGEKDLYGTGGSLEFTWHFRPGRPVEGRLRAGGFALGGGSKQGRFAVDYKAHSEGIFLGWDFLFVPQSRVVIPFLGVGGYGFRYSYRHVPDYVTLVDPAQPPVRRETETTAALGASVGLIVPVTASLEVELRYNLLKHPVFVVVGPVADGFLGDTLDPAPSHLALGVNWRF